MSRRLAWIAIAGALCAVTVLAGGALLRRISLGADEIEGRGRVRGDVGAAFDTMARDLRTAADSVRNVADLKLAVADDVPARRRLFAAAAAAIAQGETGDAAVTVYAGENNPIAWAGRPSDPSRKDVLGPERWFVDEGALGLRLLYITPVVDGPVRLGTIVSERGLPVTRRTRVSPSSAAGVDGDPFRFATRLADVSLELPAFEGGRTTPEPDSFEVRAPSGQRLLIATVSDADLASGRERWSRAATSLALIVVALTLLLMTGPLLDWRNRLVRPRAFIGASGVIAALLVLARVLLSAASPADWTASAIFSAAGYASPLLAPLLTSPFDLILTALTAAALVALAFTAVEAWRVAARPRRQAAARHLVLFVAWQVCAGVAIAGALMLYEWLLRDTIAHSTLDLLHFSLHPWNISQVGLQCGLIVAHATVAGFCVLCLRSALAAWRVPRRAWRIRLVTLAAWLAPLALLQVAADAAGWQQLPLLAAAAAAAAMARTFTRVKTRYRHGSQAFRLTLLTIGLVGPAFAFYPTLFQLAWQAKSELVATSYALQAMNQRATVQTQLTESLAEIDQFSGLADLIAAPASTDEPLTDRAFLVWQMTSLAAYPLTSSVELYGREGTLVSRFAFNLPEDLTATPRSEERNCGWDLFEEVAPFFAEKRRVLHAGRAICAGGTGRVIGSIIVHVILDYENLPFITSENPYVELLRPADAFGGEGVSGRDVEFAFYGWDHRPWYSSEDAAWPLDDATFEKVLASHDAQVWTQLRRGDDWYDVYLVNDRSGIYALGFPVVSPFGHLVNLAELTVLAVLTYLLVLLSHAAYGVLGRRGTTAPALLREVRASFYRKLFLAFVLSVSVPVVVLAVLTRNYVADEMRRSVEQEAVRTAAAARRVIEDLVGPQAAQQGVAMNDNLMVWVSRLIDQDVNVFSGPRLLASSERNLFASGLLPTRVPAEIYDGLALRNEAATITRENVGPIRYLVAGTPLTVRQLDATLTVPLTSRERQIEAQIDTFDRRALLGVLIFILCGAGVGYSMAERISDPVSRLTRATARIARGDFDARVAVTVSDELGRLVKDFNSMASELKRQRSELERTHRLEAWAEMARQVAHEIKNPLTPIQLNAEHLRRVHTDRGGPLSPVLEQCVDTILQQVRLLRQIASEFSSFASSPTARLSAVRVSEMLHEIIDPYRTGLADRLAFVVDVPAVLPPVRIDRTLVGRSLTNILENALHAMPGRGTLTVVAHADDDAVRIRVSDTGVGMDAEALARAFEPYFSTKATGTGLGLPIAKRNIELSGGSLTLSSVEGRGTTVEVRLPISNHDGHDVHDDL